MTAIRKLLTLIFTRLSFAAISKEICASSSSALTFRLIVALEKHTYLYSLPGMTLFGVYPTYSNPNGACDVRFIEDTPIIATLGEKRGSVRLIVCFFFFFYNNKRLGSSPK